MVKQHLILTPEHEAYLSHLLATGSLPVKTFKRATALLELHRGKTFQAVAQTLNVTYATVSAWCRRYRSAPPEGDPLGLLTDQPRSGRPVEIHGEQAAKLTALACSQAPDGRSQWSLRLLASKAVELGYFEHLSHNHAGVLIKKTN